MSLKKLLAGAAFLVGLGGLVASAQQIAPISQLQQIQNGDLFQDVVGGQPTAQGFYASGALLSGAFGQAAQNDNALIGGDAGQNLWQRATTGSSVTTTVTYGGPDRWAYWSGTSTAITLTRDSTAAALPTGTPYDFRLQRTAAQTGIIQSCIAQEIGNGISQYLSGHTVELDFNVYTGANFSATAMNAYITYGTVAAGDEGMQKLAWGLNAGGGGSTAWTGQTNATTGAFTGMAASTAYKVAAVATLPATATEVGVELCYTPVGTAGTTDALYFSNIELRKADYLASFANATTAYAVTTSGTNAYITAVANGQATFASIPTFSRRQNSLEAVLQYQYFWQINEPAASKVVGNGNYQTATICDIQIPVPVPMRIAPTLTIGGTAESATTWAIMIASTTPVVLASTYLIQDAVIGNTPNAIAVQGTTASKTAGQGCTLVGAGGGANIQASAEF